MAVEDRILGATHQLVFNSSCSWHDIYQKSRMIAQHRQRSRGSKICRRQEAAHLQSMWFPYHRNEKNAGHFLVISHHSQRPVHTDARGGESRSHFSRKTDVECCGLKHVEIQHQHKRNLIRLRRVTPSRLLPSLFSCSCRCYRYLLLSGRKIQTPASFLLPCNCSCPTRTRSSSDGKGDILSYGYHVE